MKEKCTGDLRQELMSQADLDQYIKDNEECFMTGNVAAMLTGFYQKKNFSKAELARRAGMSEVYLHQTFSGRRRPSRDRLLCLCAALELTIEEIQQLLKQASYAPLYPKRKRDAIIEYGIVHGMTLSEINDKLYAENERSLF